MNGFIFVKVSLFSYLYCDSVLCIVLIPIAEPTIVLYSTYICIYACVHGCLALVIYIIYVDGYVDGTVGSLGSSSAIHSFIMLMMHKDMCTKI